MKIEQIYDDYVAENFDNDPFDIYQECRTISLNQIGKLTGGKINIIDLASGTGEVLMSLHDLMPQASYYGIDLSKKMLDVARKKFTTKNKHETITLFQDTILNVGKYVKPGSMDLVTMHFVLNYVDQKLACQAAHEILSPGGFFSVASCTHEAFEKLHAIAGSLTSPEFIRSKLSIPENDAQLRAVLEETGFEVMECEIYRKPLPFTDLDHLYHFALHSGWLADAYLTQISKEEVDHYKKMTEAFFPIEDDFQAVLLIAKKK